MLPPLALLLALAAGPTPTDPAFVEGVRLLEDFEYEKATFRFREALRDESKSPEHRAVFYVYLGMTLAELREEAGARDAFTEAVRLDPDVGAPAEAPPKVKQMLEDVRARVATSGAVPTTTTPTVPPRTSTSEPAPAPLSEGPGSEIIEPPASGSDGSGTPWLIAGSVAGAAGVGALVGAGVAGWLGVDLYNQGQATEYQTDAIALRDQSVTAQIGAGVAGAAGVALVGAGVALLTLGFVE